MKFFAALAASAALFNSVAATKWLEPTRTTNIQPRSNSASAPQPFVSIVGSQFMQNGKRLSFASVDAYWLQSMTDENINATIKSIAAKNISVVRTWAFNDVAEIPESGPWFTLLAPNGTIVFNNGTSGIGRLRSILNAAEENKIMIQFVLTNNWSAFNISNITVTLENGTQVNNARGSYTMDYGGADRYVQFHKLTDHSQFFGNNSVIQTFTNNLANFIPQFASHPNILAWEIANDPRCNGTLTDPSGATACNTTTITEWHNTVSAVVKKLDPNHLISSGTQGFLCQVQNPTVCPKLFFTPKPVPSPAPGARRRSLTEKSIIAERMARWKRTAETVKQQHDTASEKRARGVFAKWSPRNVFGGEATVDAPSSSVPYHIKRQASTLGSSFDGSHGVDSLDIAAIKNIAFSTFQLFPDQNVYEMADPSLSAFNNTINAGTSWIATQATVGQMVGKPVILTSLGLVNQASASFFIPFNATQLTFPNSSAIPTSLSGSGVGIIQGQAPVNASAQASIYQAWFAAAIENQLSGAGVHDWGQADLQPAPPTPTQAIGPAQTGTFVPALPATQGVSPDDGYQAISPEIQADIQQLALNFDLIDDISIPQV